MLFLLRNIIAQSLMFWIIFSITVSSYFYSFFCTRDQLLNFLSKGFQFMCKVIFKIMGITIEYRGLENLIEGPCIIASKHESSLETSFFFNRFYPKTVYAFKKEILRVPMWGRINKVCGGLKVDRDKGAKIIEAFVEDGKKFVSLNYSVAIFPEGTRVSADKENTRFKIGVAKLYGAINIPVIPVALNTGICYPKGSFFIYPGHIIIEFLPPIYPGMPELEFLAKLQKDVNEASKKMLLPKQKS